MISAEFNLINGWCSAAPMVLKSILNTVLSSHDQKTQVCLPFWTCERDHGEKLRSKAEPTPVKLRLLKHQRSRPPPRREQFGDGLKAGGVRETGKLGEALGFKYHFLKYLWGKGPTVLSSIVGAM